MDREKVEAYLLAFVKNNPTHIGWIAYNEKSGWNLYGEKFKRN